MHPELQPLPLPENAPVRKFSAVILVDYPEGDFSRPYVLLSKRTGNTGKFTFPGGKIEPGQTPGEAAIMELRQETGLIIDPEMLIPMPDPPTPFASGGMIWQGDYFFAFRDECFPDTGPRVMEPEKHEAWAWVPIREVMGYELEGLLPPGTIGPSWFTEFTENARDAYPAEGEIPALPDWAFPYGS